MSKINFRPCIGKNYFSKGYKGYRILVLGESHYCKKELLEGGKCYPSCKIENMQEDCFSQTEDVISHFLDKYTGEPYERTFVCFERAVVGKELTQKEREEFWHGIMFYNYIQYSQSGPRKAPLPEHWSKSEVTFKGILKNYMPDCIIVWGVRLYGGLPDWGGTTTKLYITEKDSTDIRTYTINGKQVPAIKIYHPSSPKGKSWKYWHGFYKKFFSMVGFLK